MDKNSFVGFFNIKFMDELARARDANGYVENREEAIFSWSLQFKSERWMERI